MLELFNKIYNNPHFVGFRAGFAKIIAAKIISLEWAGLNLKFNLKTIVAFAVLSQLSWPILIICSLLYFIDEKTFSAPIMIISILLLPIIASISMAASVFALTSALLLGAMVVEQILNVCFKTNFSTISKIFAQALDAGAEAANNQQARNDGQGQQIHQDASGQTMQGFPDLTRPLIVSFISHQILANTDPDSAAAARVHLKDQAIKYVKQAPGAAQESTVSFLRFAREKATTVIEAATSKFQSQRPRDPQ